MIRLRTRLVLTYAACLCIVVGLLSFVIHQYSERLFVSSVEQNIQMQSSDIVDSVGMQFDPQTNTFNQAGLMAIGMDFARQGYIISIEDTNGSMVWDARQCDMKLCTNMRQQILDRMAEHKLDGEVQVVRYSLEVDGVLQGYVNIETVGPFFYSETESQFIQSLNKKLQIAGVALFALTLGISVLVAATISKPVRNASETAKKIAEGDFTARMDSHYRTTELNELTQSINDLAAALENGQKWQKRLTSNLAHELRTPLTTLQGNMEAMIDGVWEPTPQRLLSCHEEITRLSKLVEDLSEVSILEQENLLLNKTEFDIAKLCGEVVAQLTQLAAAKQVEIKYEPVPVHLTADYRKMKQVLINIITNAIRHTDNGIITLETVQQDGMLVLSVRDTGCGISEEDLPHIFDRFYRSDKSRNRDTGGAGIGLTIAKSIIDAHDGTIEVDSRMGEGTVFRLLLPLK